MWCDAFCKDVTSFPRISYVLDFIDKAHAVLHEINFFIFLRRVLIDNLSWYIAKWRLLILGYSPRTVYSKPYKHFYF